MTTPRIIATIALDTEPTQRGELYWQPTASQDPECEGWGEIYCRNQSTREAFATGSTCKEAEVEETIAASWGERGTKGEYKVWDLRYAE